MMFASLVRLRSFDRSFVRSVTAAIAVAICAGLAASAGLAGCAASAASSPAPAAVAPAVPAASPSAAPAAAPPVAAAAPSAAAPSVPVSQGTFFAISTGDVDRLVAWYGKALGFQVTTSGTAPNGIRFALLARDGALLELVQLPDARPRSAWGLPAKNEAVHSLLKIGLIVADLDALYARAQAHQLEVFFAPTQPRDVAMRTFGLKDPDGNIVQFFGT